MPSPTFAELRAGLPDLMVTDQRRLRRRLDRARSITDPDELARTLTLIQAGITSARATVAARRASVPEIEYPTELPITARVAEIRDAIAENQVVIVAGETGSGKTTQLPKICLELGRGARGLIGHTQPRRLAARTVAERVADELGTPLGQMVGYQVRFSDRTGGDTLVKLMTDGILLAEIGQDRALARYDTLIIDEAHERGLNIDFILGYVKRLLPRRPDLKVIITSATIDSERFSRHFGDAPVIEVSGRAYPVEVRYRPVADDPDADQETAIGQAVDELSAEGPGDILVFLSGEREIRDTADYLRRTADQDTEILPLYARLSSAEQRRVFAPHPGRRIVLATNVAETSLTVPGIKYVIDPGTARISRYSHRTKVQRLPIEPVSRASANQRKGRCGRLSPGVCIRLYSEEDFAARREYTEPEILRTNLASVILRMTELGLGEVAGFPFVDPPDPRQVADGVRLLEELGALEPGKGDGHRTLTPTGRVLAKLPIDPRLGRMVVEADRRDCLDEVLTIASALSLQDPREWPEEKRQTARERHARFADPDSDFAAYLNLWRYLVTKQEELSANQFRRMCRTEFLHYLRIREWQDLRGQLRQAARSAGLTPNTTPGDGQKIRMSLLAGLLSHIGARDPDKPEYRGARGARFAIFPGSTLFKKSPQWVMAAELVETTRLWARTVAKIEPEWAEELAGHLLRRSYSEPRWDEKRGAVLAEEKVTMYGLPIVTARTVNYGRIDPKAARSLFIRHALVQGEWRTHHRFFHDNQALRERVAELEHRARRRDIVADEDALYDFYDQRVGPTVVSARHFDSWWKKTRRHRPDLLTMDWSDLINPDAGTVSDADFPDRAERGEVSLDYSYLFEPGSPADGVTATVPLPALPHLRGDRYDWQVPGLRYELVVALIRSLPKPIRREFVPVTDYARVILDRVDPGEPLLAGVERELDRLGGPVSREDFQLDRIPDHLTVTFRVTDEAGRVLAEGGDPDTLRQDLAATTRAAMTRAAGDLERTGLRDWDIGELPRVVERDWSGHPMTMYPALVDETSSVAVRLFDTADEANQSHWRGVCRLLRLTVNSPVKPVLGRLSNHTKLTLSRYPGGSAVAVFDDCVNAAVDSIMAARGGPPRDEAGFRALREVVRAELNGLVLDVIGALTAVLTAAHDVSTKRAALTGPLVAPSLSDVDAQYARLIHPGFVTETGYGRLPALTRYLRALERRLDTLPRDPDRDRDRMRQIDRVQDEYQKLAANPPPGQRGRDALRAVREMIEELRVSVFAQTLKTAYPISERRILRAIDQILAHPVE